MELRRGTGRAVLAAFEGDAVDAVQEGPVKGGVTLDVESAAAVGTIRINRAGMEDGHIMLLRRHRQLIHEDSSLCQTGVYLSRTRVISLRYGAVRAAIMASSWRRTGDSQVFR